MSLNRHLFVALSSHGFGHLAQIAPVLNELRRRLPNLCLTLQCTLPEKVLRSRIQGDFHQLAEATDIGLIMANAAKVSVAESLAAYQTFHADWDNRLDREIALLNRLTPDLVLADIPYLPLAAAAHCNVPAVALCSLNWADVFQHYFPDYPDLEKIQSTMLEAYHSAKVFLCPAPSMPMPTLTNTRRIGPIAAIGQKRRAELNVRLGLRDDEILVLMGLGGIDMPLPVERWSDRPNTRWLIPMGWGVKGKALRYREDLADIPFIDLVRSCDVLLTKPGYGAFTEAVCNARPVLYVERPDWPETPWLVDWLAQYGNALGIDKKQLETDHVLISLDTLLTQRRKLALTPTGVAEAAAHLHALLA